MRLQKCAIHRFIQTEIFEKINQIHFTHVFTVTTLPEKSHGIVELLFGSFLYYCYNILLSVWILYKWISTVVSYKYVKNKVSIKR